MAGSNGYKNLVKSRAKRGKRRKLDDYETPPEVTRALLDYGSFKNRHLNPAGIFEPCAGSGRIAAVLRDYGFKVKTADIKTGADFLTRTRPWPGDIITNPPYRGGLADAFVHKALELADGKVAMLLELKFLAGSKRAERLFHPYPPELILMIPWRIMFIEGGKTPIKAQFFSHAWIVWPDRAERDAYRKGFIPGIITRFEWAMHPLTVEEFSA